MPVVRHQVYLYYSPDAIEEKNLNTAPKPLETVLYYLFTVWQSKGIVSCSYLIPVLIIIYFSEIY